MASDKFEQLLKSLEEAAGTPITGEGIDPSEPEPEVEDANPVPKLFKKMPGQVSAKIEAGNALAAMAMPAAKIGDWIVQVAPDAENVLHFQAKSVLSCQFYLRWYEKVDPLLWQNVVSVYESMVNKGTIDGESFYGSNKPYIRCKRVSATEVHIPGAGTISVPKLFVQ